VAIAALLLWLGTAAVGSYLLLSGIRAANAAPSPQEPASVAAEEPAPAAATAHSLAQATAAPAATAKPVRDKDRFDPPSLQRAKSEPLPGLRDLAEFAHPALAITGFAFWLCYVISRDRLFAMIGLGILLGAICAGLTWFAVNHRAARVTAGAGQAKPGAAPLAFTPRLIALHAAGAVLTVLLATLIAVRV